MHTPAETEIAFNRDRQTCFMHGFAKELSHQGIEPILFFCAACVLNPVQSRPSNHRDQRRVLTFPGPESMMSLNCLATCSRSTHVSKTSLHHTTQTALTVPAAGLPHMRLSCS